MKSMHGLWVIGLTMLLGACADTPAGPGDPASSATPSAKPPIAADTEKTAAITARLDPNETICRRQVTTGSRFAETRCQTRLQWDLEQREARKQTEDSQGSITPPQP